MLDVFRLQDHAQLIRGPQLHALNIEEQMAIALHHPHRPQQDFVQLKYAQMEYFQPTRHVKHFHINVSLMEQIVYYQELVKILEIH